MQPWFHWHYYPNSGCIDHIFVLCTRLCPAPCHCHCYCCGCIDRTSTLIQPFGGLFLIAARIGCGFSLKQRMFIVQMKRKKNNEKCKPTTLESHQWWRKRRGIRWWWQLLAKKKDMFKPKKLKIRSWPQTCHHYQGVSLVMTVMSVMMTLTRPMKGSKPVTIRKHGGPPSKDRPPEAKAAIVVDCVVGLRLVIDDFVQCDDDI